MARVMNDMDLLRRREAEIEAELIAGEARRAKLASELEEIRDLRARIADVAARLTPSSGRAGRPKRSGPESKQNPEKVKRRKAETAPGAPSTMPQLILGALSTDAAGGLSSTEIRDRIADRSGRDVELGAVGPIAWRMWKRGDLTKADGRYAIAAGSDGTSAP